MTQLDARILLVEDTITLAFAYASHLRNEGLCVDVVGSAAEAIDAIDTGRHAAVLLDLHLPDGSGMDVLRHAARAAPGLSVLVVTSDDSADSALEARRLGAWDYLVKPVVHARLLTSVRNALERSTLHDQVSSLRRGLSREGFRGFVGASPAMQAVYGAIENVAGSRATVFVTGESGTGKEVCAEAIHACSPRADGPFIAINCGAIPGDLMESELFGHVKGAFTGAVVDRSGAAGLADGGTLFLDEICEMDPVLQTKLLRFLQTGSVQRVGSARPEPVDVRVICATNRRPEVEVSEGRFREDLFYRLNVIPVELPPLRERGDDVLRIARTLLMRFAREEDKPFEEIEGAAADALLRHSWPGNVRELQNTIRRVVVMYEDRVVRLHMLPEALRYAGASALSCDSACASIPAGDGSHESAGPTDTPAPAGTPGAHASAHVPAASAIDPDDAACIRECAPASHPGSSEERQRADETPLVLAPDLPLRAIERRAIEHAIERCGGNVPRAAALLEVAPSTLYRKKDAWERADRARVSASAQDSASPAEGRRGTA